MENTNVVQFAEKPQDSERVARWEEYDSDRLLDIMENRSKRIGTMMTGGANIVSMQAAQLTVAEIKKVLLQRLQVPHAT
jgi:hypothetical protein